MSDEGALRERASRRWRWRLIAPGVVGGVAGPLLGNYLVAGHHRHHSLVAASAGALVGALLVVGLVALLVRRRPGVLTGEGRLSAPLLLGVSRPERRAARRAVRRVRPSTDPTSRLVEQDLARRAVRQRRAGTAFWTVMVVACALFLLFGGLTTIGRVYFGAATVGAIASLVWTVFFAARAKAYLAGLR